MKILFVLDDGLTQTSAWVRAVQYREALAARGIQAVFTSHRPALLSRLQAVLVAHRAPAVLRGLVKRLSLAVSRVREPLIAKQAKDFDIVYVLLVPRIEFYRRLKALNGPRVLMDIVDGLWLPSRRRVWGRFEEIVELVDGVICENRFVAAHIRGANAARRPPVFVVPDSPQVEDFDARRDSITRNPNRVTLGWIGSPGTCGSLYAIFEPLEKLFAWYPDLHLRLVGVDPERIPRFEKVRWSLVSRYDRASMTDEVLAMDIGLFPLYDTEESVMRGTLKAMIYMSGGAVAVCRGIGENADLIRDGENGVLAESPEEWFGKLEALILNPELRAKIADNGLRTVRKNFTRERNLDALLAAFHSVIQTGRSAAATESSHA